MKPLCSSLAVLLVGLLAAASAYERQPGATGSRSSELRMTAAPLEGDAPPVPSPEVLGGSDRPLPDAGEYTLLDLEAMALGNNPSLRAAGARIEAAEGAAYQAGLGHNPTLAYQGTEMGNEGEAGLQGAFVEQEFVRGNKLGLAQAAAGQEVRKAEANFAVQRQRVLTDVRVGCYELHVAQEAVELATFLETEWKRQAERMERSWQAGQVDQTHALQLRIEYKLAAVRVRQAENDRATAWRKLSAVLGMPMLPLARVDCDLKQGPPELNWDETLGTLLALSPELGAADAEVDRAKWALRAQAEPIPNVTVMAGVQYDNATEDTVANLEVGLPLPIFDDNRGNIQEAAGKLHEAKAEVLRLQLSLQRRLADAFGRYVDARESLRVLHDGLPQDDPQSPIPVTGILSDADELKRVLRLAEPQQEPEDVLEYFLLLRTYSDVYLAELRARLELLRSYALIEGLLLDNSLDAE